MTALYPTAVKTFPVHTNGIEFIDAAHVNSMQEEISALERVLGVNPHIYGASHPPQTFDSVSARLDYIHGQLLELWRVINDILESRLHGWHLPVCRIHCNNHSLPCDDGWYKPLWNILDEDSDGCWPGGTDLICPREGWWTIEVTILIPVMVLGIGNHHCRARLMVDFEEVCTDQSIISCGSGDFHRIHLKWAGRWRFGRRMFCHLRHIAPIPSTLVADVQKSLTFIRELD